MTGWWLSHPSEKYITGWWFQPLKNMKVRLDHHPNENGETKIHVPNHQPELNMVFHWYLIDISIGFPIVFH